MKLHAEGVVRLENGGEWTEVVCGRGGLLDDWHIVAVRKIHVGLTSDSAQQARGFGGMQGVPVHLRTPNFQWKSLNGARKYAEPFDVGSFRASLEQPLQTQTYAEKRNARRDPLLEHAADAEFIERAQHLAKVAD